MNATRRTIFGLLAILVLIAGAMPTSKLGSEGAATSPSIRDEIEELSTHIVIGVVKAVTAWSDGRGVIYSRVVVAVDSVLKGRLDGSEITIEHEGGVLGSLQMRASYLRLAKDTVISTSSPEFRIGEKVMVHLEPAGDSFSLVYEDLGKQTISDGALLEDPPAGGYGYQHGPDHEYWEPDSLPLEYFLNNGGSQHFPGTDNEYVAARAAFQEWEDDVGSLIDFADLGPTPNTTPDFTDHMNVVDWWDFADTPYAPFIAYTHVWTDVLSPAVVVQADLSVNDNVNVPWAVSGAAGFYDLQAVITHEVGHWLVLYHPGGEGPEAPKVDYGETMFWQTFQDNSVWMWSLWWGDIAGVRSLYPNTTQAGRGLGWESQGGDIALGDINGNGTQDMVLARINNGEGNYIFYWVGYDIDATTGQVPPDNWSDLRPYPYWIGEDSAGLGAALTNIDSDPRLDLVLLWVNVIPSGLDNAYYSVGMNLNADGWPTEWTPVTWGFGVSWETQGAGVALADLNGDTNHRPDMVVNWADNTSPDNDIPYRVFWDMDASGQVTGMSNEFTMADPIGTETQGVGITVLNLDADDVFPARPPRQGYPDPSTTPDLVVFWIDNPGGDNVQHYRVGWDVDATGAAGSWSRVFEVGNGHWDGSESQGGGIANADLDADGRPDLTVMLVDNPPGEDYMYYRYV